MLAGGTLVLFVMLQAQRSGEPLGCMGVCGVCTLEREAWHLQQNRLLR